MKRNKRRWWLRTGVLAVMTFIAGCGSPTEEELTAVIPSLPKLKLTPNDGSANDSFGASVALAGDTLVVGAVLADELGADSGSAYAFVRDANGEWQQSAKMLPSDGKESDNFGFSVAVSDDMAVIGSPYHSENGVASGAVYIFARNGDTWTEEAKLVASDAAVDDQFGFAVAIDQDQVIVGAPGADSLAMDSGAAYAFKRTSTGWSEQTKLLPSTPGANGFFGVSVAISAFKALVGAWDDGSGTNAGAAYVFLTDGNFWLQESKLVADDAAKNDTFGYAVALYGTTAIVTSSGNDEMGEDAGAAYVFTNASDKWTQDAKLVAEDSHAKAIFGSSAALWGDMATIGAYWDDDNGQYSGSAYVFSRQGGAWSQKKKYVPADGFAGQVFGSSVAMDGSNAIVGAYGDDDNGKDSGSVYLLSLSEE